MEAHRSMIGGRSAGAERIVIFDCTGGAGEVHTRRKLGTVAIRDNVAVDVSDPRNRLRRGYATNSVAREAPGVEISDFDWYCSMCGRHPQLSEETVRTEVIKALDANPDRTRVRRDMRLI